MRRLLLLALLIGVGTAASACDISPPAATVGNATISRSQLNAQLSQVSSNTYVQCALGLLDNLQPPVTGNGDGTVVASAAAAVITTMVQAQLVSQGLAARHQTLSDSDLQSARDDLVALLSSGSSGSSQCGLQGLALVSKLPTTFVAPEVRYIAGQERLAAVVGHVDISNAAVQSYYQAHAAEFQEVCLSGIAVNTQAQAQQIHDAIAAGAATFAAEAQQQSIDQASAANGGQLGCVPTSQIVNNVILGALANLGIGQLSPPTFEPPTNGSAGVWLILRLDGKPVIPLAQAAPQIRQELLQANGAVESAEFTRELRKAKVWVDPRYGSWSSTQGIRPPVGPKAADLPAPATAASGSSGSVLGLGASGG